jgi:CheY-like chemotaxis protein
VVWVKDGAEALDFFTAEFMQAGKTELEAHSAGPQTAQIDGIEVLRELKTDSKTKIATHVVMLTDLVTGGT